MKFAGPPIVHQSSVHGKNHKSRKERGRRGRKRRTAFGLNIFSPLGSLVAGSMYSRLINHTNPRRPSDIVRINPIQFRESRVNEGFGELEEDSLQVDHKTVRSNCRKVNLHVHSVKRVLEQGMTGADLKTTSLDVQRDHS